MKNILDEDFKKGALDFLQSVVVAIVICIIVLVFFVSPSEVEGSSMQPNYYTGDRLYTNKLSHWIGSTQFGKSVSLDYKRGDVVVVDKPGVVSLIKRVVGLPGERLKVSDGKVYINSHLLEEKYLADDVYTTGGTFLKEDKEIEIPEGKYFVMGDNRKVSSDSRYIGLIDESWIQGKIFLRIWPLNQFGILTTGEYELISDK
jgi:signal peptidase I